MGISCEIRLFPATNGKYEYAPGSIVSGVIKYYLHEDYTFTTITVSLKGQGHLKFVDRRRKRNQKRFRYRREENYVDDDIVIYFKEKEEPFQMGQYETPFSFQLPGEIPPTLALTKTTARYKLWCNIMYYVRIKFERPGLLNGNKHFKKDIKVTSGERPRLEMEPKQYSVDKTVLKLRSLFSSTKDKVTMKANIYTSVVAPGDTVKVDFEIDNDSIVEIKCVRVKLVEIDTYRPLGHYDVKKQTDIEGTYYKYGSIKPKKTMTFLSDIRVPDHCGSIDYSKMISRDYAVEAIVILPMPHLNLKLKIPVQVIDKNAIQNFSNRLPAPENSVGRPIDYKSGIGPSVYPNNGSSVHATSDSSVHHTASGSSVHPTSDSSVHNVASGSAYPSDDPPTYWEAMGEEVKQKLDSDDDDDDFVTKN